MAEQRWVVECGVSGGEALRAGLGHRLVQPGQELEVAAEPARRFAGAPEGTIRSTAE